MKVVFLFLGFLILKSYGVSYVPGTEDIPLMEGVLFVQEAPSSFDTAKGRVVISRIYSSLKSSQIEGFYRDILSNLGWKQLSRNKYRRESQVLSIIIKPQRNETLVTFELIESY